MGTDKTTGRSSNNSGLRRLVAITPITILMQTDNENFHCKTI